MTVVYVIFTQMEQSKDTYLLGIWTTMDKAQTDLIALLDDSVSGCTAKNTWIAPITLDKRVED